MTTDRAAAAAAAPTAEPVAEPAVLIIADDLSGAADTAAALTAHAPAAVALAAGGAWPDVPVVAVDTDSRHLPADLAARRAASVAARAGASTLVYKKIDSTLRGNAGPETAACLAARPHRAGERRPWPAVVSPAFPATGRTVVGGRVLVHGEPLERLAPGRPSLRAQLEAAGLTVELLGLADVRGEGPAKTVEALAGRADAVVADAETDDDLARTVAACAGLPVLLAGSGGMAHHLAPLLPDGARRPAPGPRPAARPVLVCAGSRSDVARAQLRALLEGTPTLPVPVPANAEGRASAARRLVAALEEGRDAAVFPDPAEPVDPSRAAETAAGLAEVAGAGLAAARTLVATGGETARAVLETAGTGALTLLGETEPGVVAMHTPEGLRVITKAGSFGDPGTLLRIVAHAGGEQAAPVTGARLTADT